MKKILILGSAGMLGHVVYEYLHALNKYQINDTSFPSKKHSNSYVIDVTDKKAVEKYILEIKPEIIINCIGILIKGSQQNPANAIYLNSYFPHSLAQILADIGGKLIHISTDCVFSGDKGSYIESDFKDARDIYGLSKALGEVEYGNHLTLRTSIIGPELKPNGEGLFNWFMNQQGTINGYTEAYWSGVTTLELAKVIDISIEQNLTGLYHVTNNSPIDKFNLLQLFKKNWNKIDLEINPVAGKKVNKSFKDTRKELNYEIPSYEKMLIDLKDFMFKHSDYYSHY